MLNPCRKLRETGLPIVLVALLGLGLVPLTSLASLFDEQTRVALDVSSRVNLNQVSDKSSMIHFVGLDFFRPFSRNGRDIGALLIQPYLLKAVRLSPHPGLFDDPDDTAVQFRNFYYRLPPLFNNSTQIYIGHVELPYGLEREYETNQTLQQFNNAADGGHKVDWGVMAEGYAGGLKYDVALTRGSGNEWRNDDNPYLFTGRIATAPSRWYSLGLTVVEGELWQPGGASAARDRISVDGRVDIGRWTLKAQGSRGHNGSQDARRNLLEIEWTYGYNEWVVYLQRFHFNLSQMNEDQETYSFGLRFEPTNRLQIDVDYTRDESNFGRPERELIRGQVRLRLGS